MNFPDQTPRREPIFNLPAVVTWSLGILVGIHLLRVFVLGDGSVTDATVLSNGAFFPLRVTEPEVADLLAPAWAGARYWMFLTYSLLHANFMHLGVNAVWMAAFASPLARRFGTGRFLLLSAAGSIGGAALHLLANLGEMAPMIGASAAISAHMAAVSRFAFEPGAPLSGYMTDPTMADRQPASPLSRMLRNRRAMIFLVVWFAINLVFGAAIGDVGAGNIAWQAHIGGFVAGLALFPLFDPIGPRRRDQPAG
jgi:membrane associated rhomboid family serine protease